MIEVNQKVNVYEVEGEEVAIGKEVHIEVNSHFEVNSHSRHSLWVVIVVGGKSYAVKGYDIVNAVQNAINT